ncbi:MAG TPA: peptide MFS transporter [Anaeromyxobacter sp.]|nr:peptide MFS transporter [Anaeromyxobacter sp.]
MSNPSSPALAAPAPDGYSVLDDRALLGHPRGLGLLFVVEMWERFSYYGMRAILVPYLVLAVHWPTAGASNLYGTYTSLVYLTPLVGGYLADRVIGTRRSLVIGGAVIALGHFALAFPGMPMFYLGLTLIIAGTGLFKPNSATMVGQCYRPGDPRRDAGFTIYYMGVNAGAFLGPLVVGYLAETPSYGWHWGFAAAGVGMVVGLVLYLWGRERYLPGIGVSPEGLPGAAGAAAGARPERSLLVDAIGGGVAGLGLAAFLAGLSPLALGMGAVIGAALAVTLLGTHGEERKRVIALFVVAFFVVFFWAAYEQAGSSMNLFAFRNTELRLGGWEVKASWFQAVNPFMILALAPVFAALWTALGRRGKDPSTPLKMVLGLFLLGLGFLFLVAGGRRADTGVLVSPLWLTLAYLFHTMGELCLSPVGLSYVSRIAPVRFASLLMGAWYLANAAANKIAGAVAALMPAPGEPRAPAEGLTGMLQKMAETQAGFYSIFVISSIGAAALMLLFVPLLRRLAASADGPRPVA